MEQKIPSFTVNHEKLKRGVYISRQDHVGDETITTFDIRMKLPNREPVINNAELHAMEHLGATFLRFHETEGKNIIYFGPMGCRTGYYLVIAGDRTPEDVLPLLKELYTYMENYDDAIPGASPVDCGNYLDLNLPMANYEAGKFLHETLEHMTDENMVYPA